MQNKKSETWAEQDKQRLNFLLSVENTFPGCEGMRPLCVFTEVKLVKPFERLWGKVPGHVFVGH